MIDELAQQAVWNTRRWTPDALQMLGVDFDGERFTIRIEHPDGTSHIERYAPPGMRGNGDRKLLAPAGARRDLFPAPETIHGSYIFLTEGAPAAITVISAGLEAIGVPSATSWQPEWGPRLAGQDIIVTPDADPSGRTGFTRIADQLLEHAATVRIYDPFPDRQDGSDIGDLIYQLTPVDQPDRIRQVGAELLLKALDHTPLSPLGPQPEDYQITFTKDKSPKLLLPAVPDHHDKPALCAWLTAVLRLDPAHPITAGRHEGNRGSGQIELDRADIDPMRFEPASILDTARGLIPALLWQSILTDQEPYGFKDEHARRIAFVIKLLCGDRRALSANEETVGIVSAFINRAVAIEEHTMYGTVAQRYEAAAALRRDLDEHTGRPIGPPRYLIDSNTGEIAIGVGELRAAAREHIGSSLPHGWLDARMEHIGWGRATLNAHAEPGRQGRRTPHVRIDTYRGHIPDNE